VNTGGRPDYLRGREISARAPELITGAAILAHNEMDEDTYSFGMTQHLNPAGHLIAIPILSLVAPPWISSYSGGYLSPKPGHFRKNAGKGRAW